MLESWPRPFVTVAYVQGSRPASVPDGDAAELRARVEGAPACRARRASHTRKREAGSQTPVTVLQCRMHCRAFTLYPLGYIPHERLAAAPVTLDGQVSTGGPPTVGVDTTSVQTPDVDGGPSTL